MSQQAQNRHRRPLALADRGPARRRHHPRSSDRGLRDRLQPQPRRLTAAADSGQVASTASPTTAPKPAPIGAVTVTPELVARGKALYGTLAAQAATRSRAPPGPGQLQGSRGRNETLASQQTVTADDAYLARSISDPDAQIVKGYRAGLMASAISASISPTSPTTSARSSRSSSPRNNGLRRASAARARRPEQGAPPASRLRARCTRRGARRTGRPRRR